MGEEGKSPAIEASAICRTTVSAAKSTEILYMVAQRQVGDILELNGVDCL